MSRRPRVVRLYLFRPVSVFIALLLSTMVFTRGADADPREASARQILAKALITMDAEEQATMVRSLAAYSIPAVSALLSKWKEGGFYLVENAAGEHVAVQFNDDPDGEEKRSAVKVSDGSPLM